MEMFSSLLEIKAGLSRECVSVLLLFRTASKTGTHICLMENEQ